MIIIYTLISINADIKQIIKIIFFNHSILNFLVILLKSLLSLNHLNELIFNVKITIIVFTIKVYQTHLICKLFYTNICLLYD